MAFGLRAPLWPFFSTHVASNDVASSCASLFCRTPNPTPSACNHFVTASVERDNFDAGGFVSGLVVAGQQVAEGSFPCYPTPDLCDAFTNCTDLHDVSALVTASSVTVTLQESGDKAGTCIPAFQDSLRSIVYLQEVTLAKARWLSTAFFCCTDFHSLTGMP